MGRTKRAVDAVFGHVTAPYPDANKAGAPQNQAPEDEADGNEEDDDSA